MSDDLMDFIRVNAEHLRRSEDARRDISNRVEEMRRRFQRDPVFHAKIYATTRELHIKETGVDATDPTVESYPEKWQRLLDQVLLIAAMFEVWEERSQAVAPWREMMGDRRWHSKGDAPNDVALVWDPR